jgi:hypothetical protein
MTPGRFPLQLYRGDTYRYQFRLWQDAAQTVSSDLTGASVKAEIRDRPGGTLIAVFVCNIVLPNIIDAVLDAADCAKLPSNAVWDLQLTYAMGDVATVVTGPVNVTPDVTGSAPVPTSMLTQIMSRARV